MGAGVISGFVGSVMDAKNTTLETFPPEKVWRRVFGAVESLKRGRAGAERLRACSLRPQRLLKHVPEISARLKKTLEIIGSVSGMFQPL